MDGNPLTWTNWYPGQPSNHRAGQDYAAMCYGSDGTKWGDWEDDPNFHAPKLHPNLAVVVCMQQLN